jgi:hypothetical protein
VIALLQKIPILWTHVSQLRLLILGQIRIDRRTLAMLVRRPASPAVYHAGEDTECSEGKADRIPGHVVRRICGHKSEGRDNAPKIAKSNLPCAADAASVVTA